MTKEAVPGDLIRHPAVRIGKRGLRDRPHAVARWAADAPERREVVRAGEDASRLAHGVYSEPLWHVPDIGTLEGVGDPSVPNLVAVGFRASCEASVKLRRHLLDREHTNIFGKLGV